MSMKWLLGIEALSLRVFAREQPIIREAGTLLDGKGGVQIFASESSRDGGGTDAGCTSVEHGTLATSEVLKHLAEKGTYLTSLS